MKIITVCNQKGGVGKSTVAIHLAYALAQSAEQRVLFLDFDHQGNSSKTLDKYACGLTTYDLFTRAVTLPQPDQFCLIKAVEEVIEIDRAEASEAVGRMQANLAGFADKFDYCIIDTPPGLALRLFSSVYFADFILIPIQLEEYALDGTTMMLQTIYGWQSEHSLKCEMLGLVPNLLDPVSRRQRETLAEVYKEHGGLFLRCKITKRPLIAEAIEARVPVWQLPGKNTKDATAEFAKLFDLIFPKIGLGIFHGLKQ